MRNNAKCEGILISTDVMVANIRKVIQDRFLGTTILASRVQREVLVLRDMWLWSVGEAVPYHVIMQCEKPIVGRVKLKSDWCSKGNQWQSGGGAILLSHSGDLIWVIGDWYGCQTNVVAEARALRQGLEKCMYISFHVMDIEVD